LQLLAIIIIVGCNWLVAQRPVVDSLKELLDAHPQPDTTRVNLLNDLAREIHRVDRKQMRPLTDEALDLAQQLHYRRGEAYALTNIGLIFFDKFDYPQALANFQRAIQIFEDVNDKRGIATVLSRRGLLYVDDGKHAEALDDYLRGIKLAGEAGDTRLAIELKGRVGFLYNILGEFDKAIPYYSEALNQSKQSGYQWGMSVAYNAMGKTYKTKGSYPEALEAYKRGLELDLQSKNPESIAIAYGNIGDVYERMGDYPNAFSNINKYLGFYRQPKEKMEDRISWGEWVIGKAYTHSGNADSGLYYGNQSLMVAHQAGWRLYLREITQLIAESAAKLKKWDTAYKYQVLSSYYKDSLIGQETARKTAMLETNFELDKKQAQIALLTKDKELQVAETGRERAFLYMVLGGLASFVVLAVILFRNNKQKQKANVLLQRQKREIDVQRQKVEHALEELKSTQSQLIQSEKEKMLAHHHKELLTLEAKALRAQMNPHFIYNCMNSIKALIQTDDKMRSIEYLTTFSKLIRTIFHNSDKRQISLYDEIETCRLYTQLESMRLNGKLKYDFCIDPNLDLKSLMVPALIVQPFIENAIWHGIVPKDGGAISITVRGGEDKIVCEVDDDGIGREMSKRNKPITPIMHESKGIHLSQARLELGKMLNDTSASIQTIDKVENNVATGTKVVLSFDLH
jgi:sensor histidine kinase YesM